MNRLEAFSVLYSATATWASVLLGRGNHALASTVLTASAAVGIVVASLADRGA